MYFPYFYYQNKPSVIYNLKKINEPRGNKKINILIEDPPKKFLDPPLFDNLLVAGLF